MKQHLFLTIFLLAGLFSFAQPDSASEHKKQVPYLATITTMEGKTIKGWFYKLMDDKIILLPARNRKFSFTTLAKPDLNASEIGVDIQQIRSVSVRKKNSTSKGALIGLGVGAVTGALIGLISGDDPVQPYYSSTQDPYGIGNIFVAFGNAFAMTAGEKAAAGALSFGGLGALTGVIIGAVSKKKFIIGGSKQRVRDLDGELRQRLLIK